MGTLVSRLKSFIWGPVGEPPPALPPEPCRRPIRSTVVKTAEGVPETIEDATRELSQARMLGTENLFALNKERTALEALVSELRK